MATSQKQPTKPAARRATRRRGARRPSASSPRAWCTSTRRSTTRSSPSPTRRATCVSWASAGAVGFKGSRKGTPFAAQVAAEAAARKAARARHAAACRCYVKGPGAGRESALREPAGGGLHDQHDQGRDADPAQRLPAAEAAASLSEDGSTWLDTPDAVCRLCRREGLKLFLKGERCYTDKCAIERRNYPPGAARPGTRRSSPSTRSSCARSRRCKRMYGVLEGQFRRYFEMADRAQGRHRRDPAAAARAAARQHGVPPRASRPRAPRRASSCATATSAVNGRKVDIPSFLRARPATSSRCASAAARSSASRRRSSSSQRRGVPEWLEVDRARRSPARVKALPAARRPDDADQREAGRRALLEVADEHASRKVHGIAGSRSTIPIVSELA